MCKAWAHSLSFSSSPIMFDHPRIIILMSPRSNPSSSLRSPCYTLNIFLIPNSCNLQVEQVIEVPVRNSEYVKTP